MRSPRSTSASGARHRCRPSRKVDRAASPEWTGQASKPPSDKASSMKLQIRASSSTTRTRTASLSFESPRRPRRVAPWRRPPPEGANSASRRGKHQSTVPLGGDLPAAPRDEALRKDIEVRHARGQPLGAIGSVPGRRSGGASLRPPRPALSRRQVRRPGEEPQPPCEGAGAGCIRIAFATLRLAAVRSSYGPVNQCYAAAPQGPAL